MKITDLKSFAKNKGIELMGQKKIAQEASEIVTSRYKYSDEEIKENFDKLLEETESEAYRVYLKYEKEYGEKVFWVFIENLINSGEISNIGQIKDVLPSYFNLFDKFFLSLSQSRRTRAGKSFEDIHNSLFKALNYKFDEQKVINGKPDFLMPSYEHWKVDPIDCIIFTSKRTLRERWRQIVTEGTRGRGFFLATIDKNVTNAQLEEMHKNRIYLVCPVSIKETYYKDRVNVLSFTQFFKDHLDPAMERWKRNNVIN